MIVEDRDYLTPVFAMINYILKNQIILCNTPISFLLARVQVIQPSLSALFRSPEASLVGVIVKQLGNFIPSSLVALIYDVF